MGGKRAKTAGGGNDASGARGPLKANLVRLGLITLVFLVYGNSLANRFAFDDQQLIVRNPYIKSLHRLPQVFLYNYWLEPPGAAVRFGNNAYRPLVHVTTAVDHAIWGLNPFGYHLTNLVLMALLGLALFEITFLLFGDRTLSAAAAGLYLVNPIHTEAVAFIMGRTDLLAGLLTIASLLFYWRWRGEGRRWLLAASLACWLAALASKETAAVLPAFILGLEVIFGRSGWRRLWRGEYLLYLAVFAGYFAARQLVLRFNSPWQGDAWDPAALGTAAEKIWRYLALTIWPFKLNTYYTDAFKPSWWGWVLAAPLLLLPLALAILASRKRVWAMPAWSSQLVIWGALPALGLVRNTSGVEFGERFFFLASYGASLLVAGLADALSDRIRSRPGRLAILSFLAAYALAMGAKAGAQNRVWRDDFTLFREMSRTSPGCFLAHYNLGNEFARRGLADSAEASYRRAIEIDSTSIDAHNNLGTLCFMGGRMAEAEQAYRRAAGLGARAPTTYYNLGLSLFRQGKEAEARYWFGEALKRDPGFLPARRALGIP